jgi:hypothetical protein
MSRPTFISFYGNEKQQRSWAAIQKIRHFILYELLLNIGIEFTGALSSRSKMLCKHSMRWCEWLPSAGPSPNFMGTNYTLPISRRSPNLKVTSTGNEACSSSSSSFWRFKSCSTWWNACSASCYVTNPAR